MDEKITIYTACHKPFVFPDWVNRDLFIPILCGKANYDYNNLPKEGEILPDFGDDTGDNISERNLYYAELTGTYWVWKNDKDSDIIGINHYRRFFLKETGNDNECIDRETILRNLENYDFLVHGPGSGDEVWYDNTYSVYNGYKEVHHIKDMDNALKACKELYPEIYDKFYYEIHNCTVMCFCNLLLCRRELFEKYCKFMFDIFFEVEKNIDKETEFYANTDYQVRVLAFLGERLFRPWLIANGYKFKDQQIGGLY